MDAHDAKAREIAQEYTYRLAPTDDVDDLAKAIAAAFRDVERETLERAAKVALSYRGCGDVNQIASAIRALLTEGNET